MGVGYGTVCFATDFVARIGALPPAAAQIFTRSVSTKTEVRLPLFSPGLEELADDSLSSSLLPENWVFGGELGQRIYEDVMSMDSRSLTDSCRDMFNKEIVLFCPRNRNILVLKK